MKYNILLKSLYVVAFFAQEALSQCSRLATVTRASDAAPLETCTVFDNSIDIVNATSVNLTGIETVDGQMDVIQYLEDPETSQAVVSSDTLLNITGYLSVSSIPGGIGLSPGIDVHFPKLDYLRGLVVSGPARDIDIKFGENVTVEIEVTYENLFLDEIEINVHHVLGSLRVENNSGPGTFHGWYPLLTSLVTFAGEFQISENTNMNEVLMPNLTKAYNLRIYQNPDLETINTGVKHIASIYIGENAREVSANFSNLETMSIASKLAPVPVHTTDNIDFHNLVNLYLPSLRRVNNTLRITENLFAELKMPALETVDAPFIGDGIIIQENTVLSQLEMPRLNATKSLIIAGNPRILNLTLNNLQWVENNLMIDGEFTNVEMFGLQYVGGDFFVGGAPEMDCSWFDENMVSKVQGTYRCQGNHTKPAVTRGPSTPTEMPPIESTQSSSVNEVPQEIDSAEGGLSTGAKAGVGVGAAIGGLALITGLGLLLVKRRKQKNASMEEPPVLPEGPPEMGEGKEKPEMASLAYQPPEMDGTLEKKTVEMDGTRDAREMPAEQIRDPTELPGENMRHRSELP